MIYGLSVASGILLGFVATRLFPVSDNVPRDVAKRVRIAGLAGGVVGAYLFELPADLMHLTAPIPGLDGYPIGGRTLLGGLLGGWIAVELTKKSLGYRGATGDRFAVPLAVALVFGRLGCVLAGCCPGIEIAKDSAWASLSTLTPPRFPASLVEAYFHALALVLLALATFKGWLKGLRLAAYLCVYALVRFALEEVRANPVMSIGLTYYQLLCMPLFALAGGTWMWRASGALGTGQRRTNSSETL